MATEYADSSMRINGIIHRHKNVVKVASKLLSIRELFYFQG